MSTRTRDLVDIAQFVKPNNIDGYHLDPEAHANIAEVLEQKIKTLLNPH